LGGVGEGGLLARHRAHADALLDVEAARLDDAFRERPALVARVLEVEVGVIDLAADHRAEHALELAGLEVVGGEQCRLGGIQNQCILLFTSAGSELRTCASFCGSISAMTTASPSACCASTSPHGSTIKVCP